MGTDAFNAVAGNLVTSNLAKTAIGAAITAIFAAIEVAMNAGTEITAIFAAIEAAMNAGAKITAIIAAIEATSTALETSPVTTSGDLMAIALVAIMALPSTLETAIITVGAITEATIAALQEGGYIMIRAQISV
jgi:hypothetical protein